QHRSMLVSGKGGHERVVPITEESWTLLIAHVHEMESPVVRSGHTLPETATRWRGQLVDLENGQPSMRAAGLHDSAHALLHTSASDCLENGADIREVQSVLGHRFLATTEIYSSSCRASTASRSHRRPPIPTSRRDQYRAARRGGHRAREARACPIF